MLVVLSEYLAPGYPYYFRIYDKKKWGDSTRMYGDYHIIQSIFYDIAISNIMKTLDSYSVPPGLKEPNNWLVVLDEIYLGSSPTPRNWLPVWLSSLGGREVYFLTSSLSLLTRLRVLK